MSLHLARIFGLSSECSSSIMCAGLTGYKRQWDASSDKQQHSDWLSGIIARHQRIFRDLRDANVNLNEWPQSGIKQLLDFEEFWHLYIDSRHHGLLDIKQHIVLVAFLGGEQFAGLTKSHDGHGYKHICNGSEYHFHEYHEAIVHIGDHHHHHHHHDGKDALPQSYVDFHAAVEQDEMYLHGHQFQSLHTSMAAPPRSDMSISTLRAYLRGFEKIVASDGLKSFLRSVYEPCSSMTMN